MALSIGSAHPNELDDRRALGYVWAHLSAEG